MFFWHVRAVEPVKSQVSLSGRAGRGLHVNTVILAACCSLKPGLQDLCLGRKRRRGRGRGGGQQSRQHCQGSPPHPAPDSSTACSGPSCQKRQRPHHSLPGTAVNTAGRVLWTTPHKQYCADFYVPRVGEQREWPVTLRLCLGAWALGFPSFL